MIFFLKKPAELDESLAPCPHLQTTGQSILDKNPYSVSKSRRPFRECGVDVGVMAFLGHTTVYGHHPSRGLQIGLSQETCHKGLQEGVALQPGSSLPYPALWSAALY